MLRPVQYTEYVPDDPSVIHIGKNSNVDESRIKFKTPIKSLAQNYVNIFKYIHCKYIYSNIHQLTVSFNNCYDANLNKKLENLKLKCYSLES